MKSSLLLTVASATTAWSSLFSLDPLADLRIDPKLLESAPQRRSAPSVEVGKRQTAWEVGQTVETSSGPVSGHAGKSLDQVSEYLGIPFAQPPTGDLRFAAPVKYNGTSPISGASFVCYTAP